MNARTTQRLAATLALTTVLLSTVACGRRGDGGTATGDAASPGWHRIPSGPRGLWASGAYFTGSQLLVFAGSDVRANKAKVVTFDQKRRRWDRVSSTPLEWRAGEAAAWTGRVLIVWGGASARAIRHAGAKYDPVAARWRTIAPSPVPPEPVVGAVWAGEEMFILTNGGQLLAYRPDGDTWRSLAAPPLRPRIRPAIIWTGEVMLMWGGCDATVPQCDDFPGGSDEFADGGVYDPDTNTWRMLPPAPLAARDRPQAVWTGREVLIWGGDAGPDGADGYGAAYDPGTNRWRAIADAPVGMRSNHTMLWTGNRMLVWGGVAAGSGDHFLNDGAAYDPARDRWTVLPPSPLRGRDRHVAVWTGDRMLVWGGCCADAVPFSDGAMYVPGIQ